MLTLLYHNILQAPEERLPVAYRAVTLATFERQIRRLRKSLLHPQAVHEQLLAGRQPRGVLITFDDGASGIVEAGCILAQYDAAGVAFVCPGALREGLWFYRLADALSRAAHPSLHWHDAEVALTTDAEKRQAYDTLFYPLFSLPAASRDRQLEEIISLLQPVGDRPLPSLTTLDEAGLWRAAQTNGIVFANHSWSHPDLTRLSTQERCREIVEVRDWLAKSNLPMLPWFAFPCGYLDDATKEAVARVCPIAFAADNMPHHNVYPRTSLYDMDANPLRFTLKTAMDSSLIRYYEQWRAK